MSHETIEYSGSVFFLFTEDITIYEYIGLNEQVCSEQIKLKVITHYILEETFGKSLTLEYLFCFYHFRMN